MNHHDIGEARNEADAAENGTAYLAATACGKCGPESIPWECLVQVTLDAPVKLRFWVGTPLGH